MSNGRRAGPPELHTAGACMCCRLKVVFVLLSVCVCVPAGFLHILLGVAGVGYPTRVAGLLVMH